MQRMEGFELPLWVQIFIATITAVITAIGGVFTYKKNVSNPSSNTQAIITGIGASLADKQTSQELISTMYLIAEAIKHGTEELERFRKDMVEEHSRLRKEAEEIKRHLTDR